MTNEEKTKELADFLYFKLSHIDYGTLTEKLLEMAEWKDDKFYTILACIQYSFEKQQFKGVGEFINDIKKQWEE